MSKMRLLWAAALLALCLGACAGAALAQAPPVAGWTWNVTAENIPDGMIWDQALAASISAENNSTDTNWGSTVSIMSVDTPTGAAYVKRWGPGSDDVAIAAPVARSRWDTSVTPNVLRLAGTYTWDFPVVAPPITTLKYATPIIVTHPAVATGIGGYWALADSGAVANPDLPAAGNAVVISRFSDMLPGTTGAWAMTPAEEIAGLVPFITLGTGAGTTYSPDATVTRDQMAVFISRAEQLATAPFEAKFVDVDSGYWAWPQIEALARSGITLGTDPTHFTPGGTVSRGQMAAFIARGLCNGDSNVPAGPGTATFTDVATGHIFFKYVEYAVANNITLGTTPTTFSPDDPVSRGQMAFFLYRAYVQSTPAVVVLAGPAVTNVDLSTIPVEDGWSTAPSGESADPGFAYVGFDAVRINPAAAVTVDFKLMNGTTPTAVAVASGTDVISATEVQNAQTAASATGVPYVYATWDIDTGIPDGNYVLKVSVNGIDLPRTQAFRIGAPTPPTPPTVLEFVPTADFVENGTIVSGDAASLGADDNNYVVVNSAADGTAGLRADIYPTLTPDQMLDLKIEFVMKTSVDQPAGFGVSTSGTDGSTGWMNGTFPDFVADTEQTYTAETCNTAKFVDMFYNRTAHRTYVTVFTCGCPDGLPGGLYTLSIDMMKMSITQR